jgi:alginate O-acetyltransferase complex protein AlgI
LIAGPILRYRRIAPALIRRDMTVELFASGVRRFIQGLAKKVLIADTLGSVADPIFNLPAAELTPGLAWLGLICFTLQLYFDFSAYSDMAIGLGKMFGFRFPENFNYPYIADSLRNFWARWNITLTLWFRDYVYIPLEKRRRQRYRSRSEYSININLMLVFLLSGLWHGAGWNFVVWGLIHGFFMTLESAGMNRRLNDLWQPLRHAYTLLIVMLSLIFFRSHDLTHAGDYLIGLFDFGNPAVTAYSAFYYLNNEVILALIIGMLWATPIFARCAATMNDTAIYRAGAGFLHLLLAILCLLQVAAGTYQPFIYFRF